VTDTMLNEWRRIALASMALSDDKLLAALALVDRIPPCNVVVEVLDKLRPRLQVLRPRRKITPQRLLFLPVEDQFNAINNSESRDVRPTRDIIQPCLQIIRSAEPDLFTDMQARLHGTDHDDFQSIRDIKLQLWTTSEQILSDFVTKGMATSHIKSHRRATILPHSIIAQISAFCDILGAAPEIEALKSRLNDHPMDDLSESDVIFLRNGMTKLTAQAMRKGAAFAAAVVDRLPCTGEVIGVISRLSLPISEVQRIELIKSLGHRALVAMQNNVINICNQKADDITEPENAALALRQTVIFLNALEQNLDPMTRYNAKEIISKARKRIGDHLLQNVVVAAERSIIKDIWLISQNNLDKDDMALAQDRLDWCTTCIAQCIDIADSIGVRSELEASFNTISRMMKARAERYADGEAMGDQFVLMIRLIELLVGADAAQRVLSDNLRAFKDDYSNIVSLHSSRFLKKKRSK